MNQSRISMIALCVGMAWLASVPRAWTQADQPPMALCHGADLLLSTGNGKWATIPPGMIDAGSFDDRGITWMEVSPPGFGCDQIGQNTVVLTVVDTSGFVSRCETGIMVVDDIFPLAKCRDAELELDGNGKARLTLEDVDGGVRDNCGIERINLDVTDFTCTDLGPNKVILTAEDFFGNQATCTATVTVSDNIAPKVTGRDVDIALDENGDAVLDPKQVLDVASDNCEIVKIEAVPDHFTVDDLGENPVKLKVYDRAGNEASCTVTVRIVDEAPPNAVCQPVSIYLDPDGQALVPADYIDGGSTDSSGIDRLEISKNTFTCDDLGINPVTLTVYDINGNSATCETEVTVLDNVNACGGEASSGEEATTAQPVVEEVTPEEGEGEGEGEGEPPAPEPSPSVPASPPSAPPAMPAPETAECQDIEDAFSVSGSFEQGELLRLAVPCPVKTNAAYEWRKDGKPLQEGNGILGVHDRMLCFAALNTTDAGSYTCAHDGGLFGPVIVVVDPATPKKTIIGLAVLGGALLGAMTVMAASSLLARRRNYQFD